MSLDHHCESGIITMSWRSQNALECRQSNVWQAPMHVKEPWKGLKGVSAAFPKSNADGFQQQRMLLPPLRFFLRSSKEIRQTYQPP